MNDLLHALNELYREMAGGAVSAGTYLRVEAFLKKQDEHESKNHD